MKFASSCSSIQTQPHTHAAANAIMLPRAIEQAELLCSKVDTTQSCCAARYYNTELLCSKVDTSMHGTVMFCTPSPVSQCLVNMHHLGYAGFQQA